MNIFKEAKFTIIYRGETIKTNNSMVLYSIMHKRAKEKIKRNAEIRKNLKLPNEVKRKIIQRLGKDDIIVVENDFLCYKI